MFKLVKVLNAPSNNPDAFRLAINTDNSYIAGTPVYMDEDGMPANCTATTAPEYMMLEGSEIGDGKTELLAVRILPSMVFETTASASLAGLLPGNKVQLAVKSGVAVGISATQANGVATIYRIDSSASGAKVLVTF